MTDSDQALTDSEPARTDSDRISGRCWDRTLSPSLR